MRPLDGSSRGRAELEYFYGVEKPKTGAPGVRPFNKEVPGLAHTEHRSIGICVSVQEGACAKLHKVLLCNSVHSVQGGHSIHT